jgi:hypothetical protein
MDRIATGQSWQNFPIQNPKRIIHAISFAEQQFLILQKGLIPNDMESKWFVFYENSWLSIHRSWTGFGIYKAQIIKEGDAYLTKEFWVETNEEKYKCGSDEWKFIFFLLSLMG